MTLAANESLSGGFVWLPDGSLSVVTSGGVAFSGGYLRDADGRVVMVTSGPQGLSGGFVRDASGALVVSTTEGGALASGGQLRDAAQNLVVATSGGQAPSGGFLRDAAGASVVTGLSTPQLVLTPVGSDNFNRANGAIAGSNNWLATFDGDMSISANEALGINGAFRGDYRTETYTAGQYSQATIGSLRNIAGSLTGVTVRNSASGNDHYALIYFHDTGSSGNDLFNIYKRTAAGGYTLVLPGILGAISAADLAQGDTLALVAEGTRLTGYKNGVAIITATDSSIAGPGAPGIISFDPITLDNWQGGNAATNAIGAAIASDNFARADGNMSAGQANWTTLAGTLFTGLTSIDAPIVSGQLVAGSTVHNAAIRNDAGFTNNHWSSLQMGLTPLTIPGAGFVGVLTRLNSGGGSPNSGYLFTNFAPNATSAGFPGTNQPGSYRIYRLDNGTSVLIAAAQIAPSNGGGTAPQDPAGTAYTGVSNGSRHSFRVNGVEVLAVTDATYPAGKPGVMIFPPSTADNWSGGNV